MTPYTKLQMHLERHQYKRGANKGHAPADSSRRGKNHFLVLRQGDTMCVRMYQTNLIEVTPDNTVRISMGGWWTSTTKQNINEAMYSFLGWGGIQSRKVFNYNQTVMRANGKDYKFYDGMEFTYEGELLSPPSFFERKRTDRDATAEFRADIEESGFKGVFPVLFATAEPDRWANVYALEKWVTQECHSGSWPLIAAKYKWLHDDHKSAYRAIVSACTYGKTLIEDTDVTVL